MENDFYHLHLHTEYSLLDSLCCVDELLDVAEERGWQAMAITDHHNLRGAIKFYQRAKRGGIKPIIGTELNIYSILEDSGQVYHLTVLARNRQGYQNLLKLISKSNLEKDGVVTPSLFRRYSQGLIILSGCRKSEVDSLLMADEDKLMKVVKSYREITGQDNYYLELQRFGQPGEEELISKKLELARRLNIPTVVTNNVHYLQRRDSKIHARLLKIESDYQRGGYEKLKDEFYLKNSQEMNLLFYDLEDALQNTRKIAQRCELELELDKARLPELILTDDYSNSIDYLYQLCLTRTQIYDQLDQSSRVRLESEIKLIDEMGLADYYLIIWDVIGFARENNILILPKDNTPYILVSYLLNIIEIDLPNKNSYPPLDEEYDSQDLLFIRFRVDHCGQQQIVEYLKNKYGERSVAYICNFINLGSRLSLEKKSLINLKENRNQLEDLPVKGDVLEKMVISPQGPLDRYLPLEYSKQGHIISQYDEESIDSLGLSKLELSKNKYLSIIRLALELMVESRGIELKIGNIPVDDEQTYQILGTGRTIGCFRLEQQVTRAFLKELKPDSFDRLIFIIGLQNSRASGSGLRSRYGAIFRKEDKLAALHPILKEILDRTDGLLLFKDQLIEIVQRIAGFSLKEAEELFKTIRTRQHIQLAKQKLRFINSVKFKGLSTVDANYLFNKLAKSAHYCSERRAAIADAYLAYLTAYFKAHFSPEYLTALLNISFSFDSLYYQYLKEIKEDKISILPPDRESNNLLATTDGEKIRLGLLMGGDMINK